eukprot:440041-Prymnesium_polylepis.1
MRSYGVTTILWCGDLQPIGSRNPIGSPYRIGQTHRVRPEWIAGDCAAANTRRSDRYVKSYRDRIHDGGLRGCRFREGSPRKIGSSIYSKLWAPKLP